MLQQASRYNESAGCRAAYCEILADRLCSTLSCRAIAACTTVELLDHNSTTIDQLIHVSSSIKSKYNIILLQPGSLCRKEPQPSK
jgi:hypothetical protein